MTRETTSELQASESNRYRLNTNWLFPKQIFWALKAIVTRQSKLKFFNNPELEYQYTFNPTRKGVLNWQKLYPASIREGLGSYFAFASRIGVIGYYRIFHCLGINMCNLLHLRWELETEAPFAEGEQYTSKIVAERLEPRPGKRAVLVIKATITNSQGNIVSIHRDYFMIRNAVFSDACTTAFEKACPAHETISRQRDMDASDEIDGLDIPINIPSRAGLGYARVSGDYNFVHIVPLLHRLFGHRKPFVQGLYTGHRVLMEILSANNSSKPKRFGINFTRPAFEGTQCSLRVENDQFALLENGGRVLAVGKMELGCV